jgi:SM-20-related protein
MTLARPLRDFDWIADRLASERWLVFGDWLEPALQQSLLDVARQRSDDGELRAARVGRAEELRSARDLRGDAIQWLEHDDPADCVVDLLDRLDRLREALNQRLYLGLVEIEAHLAHYPPGARYQRHLDRFRSDDARALSAVIHLGDPWLTEHGGELRLYVEDPDGETSIDLPPIPGQLVLFLSGEIEHEVLPTRRDRYSVAGWMRQRKFSLV